jgi:hypothetical protein
MLYNVGPSLFLDQLTKNDQFIYHPQNRSYLNISYVNGTPVVSDEGSWYADKRTQEKQLVHITLKFPSPYIVALV